MANNADSDDDWWNILASFKLTKGLNNQNYFILLLSLFHSNLT